MSRKVTLSYFTSISVVVPLDCDEWPRCSCFCLTGYKLQPAETSISLLHVFFLPLLCFNSFLFSDSSVLHLCWRLKHHIFPAPHLATNANTEAGTRMFLSGGLGFHPLVPSFWSRIKVGSINEFLNRLSTRMSRGVFIGGQDFSAGVWGRRKHYARNLCCTPFGFEISLNYKRTLFL